MNSYTFHITLYDLGFLGAIFIGLTFALLLWFAKSLNQVANRFLALALGTMILWMVRLLSIDIRPETYLPHWDRLPTQFLLALGPLAYFYVLKITNPAYKFGWRDWLHFSPVLLELSALVLEISESTKTGAATYATQIFQQLNPVLQLFIFISVITYLHLSHKRILRFYKQQPIVMMDRSRLEFRWLRRLLGTTALLWVAWACCAAVNIFGYHNQLGTQVYYPFYILFAVIVIWTAAAAFLKPQAAIKAQMPLPINAPVPAELRQKGAWLKRAMEANLYYQDPELNLSSLAEKVEMPPHELSRVINTVFKKNFNDFINEYRVMDAARKMQDPAYDNITLLGIAFEAGFNSRSTFNRIFRQLTGKSPVEYKTGLKNEHPTYNLGGRSQFARVILSREAVAKWPHGKLNRHFMFRNYLKTAWRHFRHNKAYTFINITGLALGICSCFVIFLIINYHLSFDNFHPGMDRVYCVDIHSPGGHDNQHWNSVPAPMPAAMQQEMPGFETVAAFHHYQAKVTIPVQGSMPKKIDAAARFIITEPAYFNIFQYTWLAGNVGTSLNKPNTVVLTESRAHTYFGNLPADKMVGRTVIYDDSLLVTVTGILQDWKGNSDFDFSDFISYATINHSFLKNDIMLDNWNQLNHGSQVLVKLNKGVSPLQVNSLFPAFVKKHLDPDPHSTLQATLQPFSGIHFHAEYGGEGEKASLPVLLAISAVAVFILLIAAFNFINLSTAQAVQRTKEIGIRKVLGSSKTNILFQFLTETFMLSLAAALVAAVAVTPVLKAFGGVTDGVTFAAGDVRTWLFLLCTCLVVTVLAGLYPAGVLSRFVPVTSLKGAEKAGGKGYLRKALTVFQFTISIVFIIGAIVAGKQITYMASKDLGLNVDAVITLRPMWNDKGDKMKVLAQKVSTLPGADKVLLQAFSPIGFAHMTNSIQLPGTGKDQIIEASQHSSNEDFISFYGIKLLAGRNLLHGDSSHEYLINQTCANALGFTDYHKAIGKMLIAGGTANAYPIVGVVNDFYENSFHQKIPPVIITHDPALENCIAIKTSLDNKDAGDLQRLISGLEKQWKIVYPEEPFDYSFLDDAIKRLYENEVRMQRLVNTATLIAIFISCMGLLGLAMFTTERRTKEIGIRKVLGASVISIVTLLSREVALLITLSLTIASPLAYLLVQPWLQSFAYRTSMDAWIFIFAGCGALAIAFATISYQSLKAALANPVKSLRTE